MQAKITLRLTQGKYITDRNTVVIGCRLTLVKISVVVIAKGVAADRKIKIILFMQSVVNTQAALHAEAG